ncbi:MAG: hypothetical protein LBP59_03665 [Planctomycetaceae bacterium]|nr:hypothetical protein [Planctomycetaceae bacterium]
MLLVLEIQRFKSVKACRPKARQAKVNANSSTNSLKIRFCPVRDNMLVEKQGQKYICPARDNMSIQP